MFVLCNSCSEKIIEFKQDRKNFLETIRNNKSKIDKQKPLVVTGNIISFHDHINKKNKRKYLYDAGSNIMKFLEKTQHSKLKYFGVVGKVPCGKDIEEYFLGYLPIIFCDNTEVLLLSDFMRLVGSKRIDNRIGLIIKKNLIYGYYLTRISEQKCFKLNAGVSQSSLISFLKEKYIRFKIK